jgi:multidrug resistance efflux pump
MTATLEQPRVRSDLRVSEQNVEGKPTFVIKDPVTGRFFRFGPTEHFIFQQLDGATSFNAVRQRFEATFGTPVSAESVGQFVATLRRLGLLETQRAEGGGGIERRRGFRGNLLYLRLKAFDPDRLLDRLLPRVGFFFTRSFLIASAALITLGFVVSVTNSVEIGRDLVRLYHVQALLVAWLVIFAVTTAHEFAHGLTCKRFGGEVHEMGFLLLYFQLAFYCNVSDAWLFPEKAKRLWVTFAGPYFELFLWAVAVLTWRVTQPDTWLSFVALVVVVTSGLKLVINLNPLIKLDGYYLLSDYLGVPNLRMKSFAYLKDRWKRLSGTVPEDHEEITPRERRIYLAYGLLAGAYSFWLLSLVAMHFGGYLVARYQGLGFILFAALLFTMFRPRIMRALARPAPGLAAPKALTAWANRRKRSLLALALALAVAFLVRLPLTVSGEFTVSPTRNADVRAQVEGLLEEVYVDEGDLVKAGEPIARLSNRDAAAELGRLEAAIDETRAGLRKLEAGPRREEVQLAQKELGTATTRWRSAANRYREATEMHAAQLAKGQTTLEKAEERLKYAGNDLGRLRTLYQAELISRKQFEEAEEQEAVRRKELAEARAELKAVTADDLAEVRKELAVAEKEREVTQSRLTLLLAGARPEEIEATRAELAGLEVRRRHVEEQLALLRVVSPVTGVITTPKLREDIGRYFQKGDLIAKVHELQKVKAEIAVSEKEIGDVRAGQPVEVRARAYPETTFTGRVTAIGAAAVEETQGGGLKILKVTTEIDNPGHLLKGDMSGTAKIVCGERRIVDLMTRRLARYVRVEVWSWWW